MERCGYSPNEVCNDADHARIRRLLSHAFSESALRRQEPLINKYLDLLIHKLQDRAPATINIVRWYNFTTFDIIGDLTFAEHFGALRDEEYHVWIANIFKGLNMIQRHNDEKGMTRDEITRTSGTLIIAGSETSATLLSGVTYLLLRGPEALEKLKTEIRTTFREPRDITFQALASLLYLNACIQEALRMYPPVPGVLPRRVEAGGVIINGYYLPEGTSVGVHQWSINRSSKIFTRPDDFIPERWLGNAGFVHDNAAALQPFSVGPRNCLGQHLAWAEMRAILARMIWHFDLELCEDSLDWMEQKVFIFWEKPALNVKLQLRDFERE
ncbi:MAG: hypothetical protein M1820_006663 [Bogoriella megaspora]|nr:MAG: hypothetical protein M1820_006663 [Bogoriella megaspora]